MTTIKFWLIRLGIPILLSPWILAFFGRADWFQRAVGGTWVSYFMEDHYLIIDYVPSDMSAAEFRRKHIHWSAKAVCYRSYPYKFKHTLHGVIAA